MQDVTFVTPTDLGEAVQLMTKYGGKAKVLAGGTDLVPRINYYEMRPEVILYLGNLGIHTIKESKGGLTIGACTPIAAILDSDLIAKKAPILQQAAAEIGSPAIRSRGTLGGNIMNASPAADLVGPLHALDATLTLVSSGGERTIPIEKFFTGPGKTICADNEFLKEIHIPATVGGTSFIKLGKRKAQTLAIISVSVRLEVEKGTCKTARIALGSMAPTVVRCQKAEDMLNGKAINDDLLRSCAKAAIAETSPIDDQRASAWYRCEAGVGVVRQSLFAAAGLEYTD